MSSETHLIALPEVRARTTLSQTEIYRRIAEGTFPRPIPLGPRRVAWSVQAVTEWIEARIEAANTKAKAERAQ